MKSINLKLCLPSPQEQLAQHAPAEGCAGRLRSMPDLIQISLKNTWADRDCPAVGLHDSFHLSMARACLLHYLDLADGAPLTSRTITFLNTAGTGWCAWQRSATTNAAGDRPARPRASCRGGTGTACRSSAQTPARSTPFPRDCSLRYLDEVWFADENFRHPDGLLPE